MPGFDEFERWLNELQWGDPPTGISATLPKALLERVARDLYETAGDQVFHGSRKETLPAIRAGLEPALVATAIVDQMEATR
ncbi:MAG: hypothetical protein M3P40_08110 [Actinomycetota bacterium]|nr:hypothetical protein [Actinomycetota bacterium]